MTQSTNEPATVHLPAYLIGTLEERRAAEPRLLAELQEALASQGFELRASRTVRLGPDDHEFVKVVAHRFSMTEEQVVKMALDALDDALAPAPDVWAASKLDLR